MSTQTDPSWDLDQTRLRRLGNGCTLSGVLGVVIAVITVAVTPAVPPQQWSYPFAYAVGLAVGVVLAVIHLLTAGGIVGVSTATRGSRLLTGSLRVALAGFLVLALCEILSGFIGREDLGSSTAVLVSALFGISSLLAAVATIVAGVVLLRRGQWDRVGAAMLVASGAASILLVTPATVVGSPVLRMVALSIWSLCFIPLGLAVRRSRPAADVGTEHHSR